MKFRSKKKDKRKRIVYPITPRRFALARRVHSRRSKMSRTVDEARRAPIAEDYGVWRKDVNRLDIQGVDTPSKRSKFVRIIKRPLRRIRRKPKVEVKAEPARAKEEPVVLKPSIKAKKRISMPKWDFPHRAMNALQYWWAKRKVAEAGIDPHEIDWDLTYGEIMGQLDQLTGKAVPSSAIMMAGGEGIGGIGYLRRKGTTPDVVIQEAVQRKQVGEYETQKAWANIKKYYPNLNYEDALIITPTAVKMKDGKIYRVPEEIAYLRQQGQTIKRLKFTSPNKMNWMTIIPNHTYDQKTHAPRPMKGRYYYFKSNPMGGFYGSGKMETMNADIDDLLAKGWTRD